MYAQLGDIIFEGLKGFTGYRAKYAQQLAQHALIDGKPKLQKTGDALDELQVDMTFHRSFCNPESEIAKLKQYVLDGAILPLITGTGETVGNFTVASMDVSVSHTGPSGLLVLSTVSVNLLEASDSDQLGAAISAAKKVAFAVLPNSPVRSLSLKAVGPGLAVASSLKSANAHQIAGKKSLDQAKVNTPIQAAELRKAKDSFKKVKSSMDSFRDGIAQIRGTINNVTTILAAAESVKTYADNTVAAIEAGDIDAALAASNDVEQGIIATTSQSSQIIVLTASRRI